MGRTRPGTAAIVLTVGLLLAGCSSVKQRMAEPPQALATFPFDPHTRWVLLPVTFQGEQYRFILDTGSTNTIYDASFRDRLGKRFLWPKKGTAADGKPFVYEYFHTPEAFVGPLKINHDSLICVANVSGISSDPQIKIHGIVGMDFLKDYVVQIDSDRASVSLFRSQRGATCPQWGDEIRIKHKPFSSLPYVEGQVEGIRAAFLVDTGAIGFLSGRLESSVFEKVQSEAPMVTYGGQGTTLAQAAAPKSGSVALPDRLCLGGLVCQGTAFRQGHSSVLGLPFFSGHIVTFDFPNSRLYLRPAQNREAWGGGMFQLGDSGFGLCRQRGGLSVCTIDCNGIGYCRGVRQNDFLLEIDGRNVSGLTLIELLRFLVQHRESENNDAITLTFGRGDAVHHVSFRWSDLAPKKHGTH